MKFRSIFLISISIVFLLFGNLIAEVVRNAWIAYGLIIGISMLVFSSGGVKMLFTIPIFFYVWFTFLNIAAIFFLHLGNEFGANYFIIKIFPDHWHYRILIEEQIYFSAAIFLAIPFLSKRKIFCNIEGNITEIPYLSKGYYYISKNYWWIVYAVGVFAALTLIYIGGDNAALTRRARVAGYGALVVLQYLALVGFAMYIVTSNKHSILYDFGAMLILSIPLILTQERSFFIIMWLVVIAYHVLYTHRIKIHHLIYLAIICGVAVIGLGVWRAAQMDGLSNTSLISAAEKDLSMNIGYLLYRENILQNSSYNFKTLILGFGFFSRGIKFLFGDMPISPNNYFTDMLFPQIYLSSTFSMGYLGEAYYIMNEERWVYYLITVFLLTWLENYVIRGNPVVNILLIGLVFRVAKGGIIAGMSTMLPTIILTYLVYFVGTIFVSGMRMQAGRERHQGKTDPWTL